MISAKDLKDSNIDLIARVAREVCPGSKVILFGSRARFDFNEYSDYDVLVVVSNEIDQPRTVDLATEIRTRLARKLIPVDVIVETQQMFQEDKASFWTVVHDAVREGVEL
jgi:uncharacterized protein